MLSLVGPGAVLPSSGIDVTNHTSPNLGASCLLSIWLGLIWTCLVDLGPLSPWLAGWGLLIVRLCHLRSVPHGGTATGWLSKVLLEGARCSGASTATKQASRQATSTNSPAPPPIRGEGEDIILTERQSCYLGKSATWGKNQVAGNKECREVAARRNPSSTVPRSIIPHSPNPASLEAQPLRLLHLLLQTLPQTWRNWIRPRPIHKIWISGWSPKRYPCLENMLSLLGLLSCPALSCDCLSSSEQ